MSDGPIGRLNAALAGRYRLEHQLGEGGMATVDLVHDFRHDRRVAVKVLRPELAGGTNDWSSFNENHGRFSPEGSRLACVSDASGENEIYFQRLDGMRVVGGLLRVSDGGGTNRAGAPTGRSCSTSRLHE